MATTKAKFSPNKGGIYLVEEGAEYPLDAVDIPNSVYEKYINGDAPGKALAVEDGVVKLVSPPEVPAAPQSVFSSLEFIEKFTDEEQLAIVTATLANPTVKLWYDKLLAADSINLEDARLIAGMDALVAASLLTAERKDAIMP